MYKCVICLMIHTLLSYLNSASVISKIDSRSFESGLPFDKFLATRQRRFQKETPLVVPPVDKPLSSASQQEMMSVDPKDLSSQIRMSNNSSAISLPKDLSNSEVSLTRHLMRR